MFDIFAKLLSSIASFLFPLFASYKALQTSDPAQLSPWLMYWVVLACALLVESWTDWFLVWIPFYAYLRLLFLLYLVLPQTQGARVIYQTRLQPWLHANEHQIEAFIASAHHRLRHAGIASLKHAIELLRTNVLGLPPSPPSAASTAPTAPPPTTPQSYTQSLLARFTLPAARWPGAGTGTPAGGVADFYGLLASAVGAATGSLSGTAPSSATAERAGPEHGPGGFTPGSTLVPDSIQGATARRTFIAAQRERLGVLLSALEREETRLEGEEAAEEEEALLPPLAKSRSEADFEKLEAESGEEEEDAAGLRRRTPGGGGAAAGWVSWAWGAAGSASAAGSEGRSSGAEK